MTLLAQLLWLFLVYENAAALPPHGLALYDSSGLKYRPGQPFAHANPAAPKGGTLALGDFGAFTKLNPLSLKGVMPADIGGLIFESPMTLSMDDDEPFSVYTNLVETVDLAPDRMSMTYRIRDTARFSDGHPVTADDFVFSERLRHDPEYHPSYKALYKDLAGAEKLDDHTVKYAFKTYNQSLPLIIGQMPILPKHVYGQAGKNFGADFDTIAVGSGPYVVDKYEFGKYIALKRNPRWWGRDLATNRGRYNFDALVWKIYTDPVALREAFKGGDVDAQAVNSSRDWALDYQGDFVKKGYYLREEFPHKRVAGMQGFVMNLRNDIFKSRKTRAALAMVLDFEWMSKNLFYGQYTRNACFFDNHPELKPKGLPQGEVLALLQELRDKHGDVVPKTVFAKPVGAPGEGIPLDQNLETAKILLDSEGWKPGPNGIRVKNGKPLRFRLLLEDPSWMRIAEPYQHNLRKIGADLQLQVTQRAEYEEKLTRFDFDMMVADYEQSRTPANEQRYMWGSAAAKTPGSLNYAGIQNPAIDELIEKIAQARTRKTLVTAVQALDRILTHQFYVVPHWYIGYDRLVYWNKFSRPAVQPTQSFILNNVMEWWWQDEEKTARLKAFRAGENPIQ